MVWTGIAANPGRQSQRQVRGLLQARRHAALAWMPSGKVDLRFRPRRRVPAGVLQRAGGGSGASPGERSSLGDDLRGALTSEEVDTAWANLLAETLPEDKRDHLNQAYLDEKDPAMRYNMLLEFSSYLRQGNKNVRGGNADERAGQEGFGWGGGARGGAYGDDAEGSLGWEICRVVLIVLSIVLVVVGGARYIGSRLDQMPSADDELLQQHEL